MQRTSSIERRERPNELKTAPHVLDQISNLSLSHSYSLGFMSTRVRAYLHADFSTTRAIGG